MSDRMSIKRLLIFCAFSGVAVAVVGFAISEAKNDLGSKLFDFGWLTLVSAAIARILLEPSSSNPIIKGLKLAGIGFGVVVVGDIIESAIGSSWNLAKFMHIGGMTLVVLGILKSLIDIQKSHPGQG